MRFATLVTFFFFYGAVQTVCSPIYRGGQVYGLAIQYQPLSTEVDGDDCKHLPEFVKPLAGCIISLPFPSTTTRIE